VAKSLSLQDRVALKERELKRKAVEDFLMDNWLHPVFVPHEKKVFKRISGPIAFDLEDEDQHYLESLRDQLPQSR
jgi:hypothetical protein